MKCAGKSRCPERPGKSIQRLRPKTELSWTISTTQKETQLELYDNSILNAVQRRELKHPKNAESMPDHCNPLKIWGEVGEAEGGFQIG